MANVAGGYNTTPSGNKQGSDQTYPKGSSLRWYIGGIVVLIIVLVGMVAGWRLIQQSNPEVIVPPEERPQTVQALQYFSSIPDTETRALAGAHEVWLYGTYLYVTSIKDNGFEVWYVSDPANPEVVHTMIDTPETFTQKAHTILFKDGYGYLSSTGDSAIQVFNVADPANPVPITAVHDNETIALGGVHEIAMQGNYIYAAGREEGGIAIFHIMAPGKLVHVASIFDNEEMALKRPEGLLVTDKGYAYVMSTREGLEVLNVSNPAKPTHVKAMFDADNLHLGGLDGMGLRGEYLYLVGKEGLAIYNISRPTDPMFVSGITIQQESCLDLANHIVFAYQYAFIVSESADGCLLAVDISIPQSPKVKEALYTDDSKPFIRGGHHIAVVGDYLYITGVQDGVGIVKYR